MQHHKFEEFAYNHDHYQTRFNDQGLQAADIPELQAFVGAINTLLETQKTGDTIPGIALRLMAYDIYRMIEKIKD